MKKTMKLALLACFILFACALMFTACEKEDTQTSNDAADVSDTTTINNVTNATANNDAVNNLRKEDALKEGQRIYKEMYEADIADGIHDGKINGKDDVPVPAGVKGTVMYEKECFYYVTLNDYHVGYEYDEWDCFTRQELEDLRKESAALQAAVNGYKEAVAMAFADGKIEDGTYTIGNYTFIFSNSIDNPIVTGTLNGYYAKVTNGHVEVTTTDPNS